MSHTSAVGTLGCRGEQSTTRTVSQEYSLSPLCRTCREGPFSYKGLRERGGYHYKTTWSGISQSIINDNCSWCHILKRVRDGLPPEKYPPPGEDSVEVMLDVILATWPDRPNITIRLNDFTFRAARYDIYALPEDSTADQIAAVLDPPKEPFFDHSQALRRIAECNMHRDCPPIEKTNLPTRVIDCSDPSRPRLVETGRQMQAYYCALSYVWGGEQPQKTITSNIDTYVRKGIKVPLPQTIMDAISVTNRLGIRYLWVDALCIIQDSDDDKNKELEVMANIYRHASVTIAARNAWRANQGFFPDENEPYVLPFFHADVSKILLYFRPERHFQPPLNRRAWCLQESFLSPRVLEFQSDSVMYRCRTFDRHDHRHNSHVSDPLGSLSSNLILFRNYNSGGTSGEVDHETLHKRWWSLLRDYSACKISVASDKFVAIASIVEVFQSVSKDAYVAGLWRWFLIRDLLWQVDTYVDPLPRPRDYRAPSWSWASVDGKLGEYDRGRDAMYEAEILGWDVTLKTPILPFGEITDARLTIKGKMDLLRRGAWKEGDIYLDCLEGTQGHPWVGDAYLIILSANLITYEVHQMQGLILLPIIGEIGQYRRVAKWALLGREIVHTFGSLGFPPWFGTMPLKTITLI